MADITTAAFWTSAIGLFVLGVLLLLFAYKTKTGRSLGKLPHYAAYLCIGLALVSYLGIYALPAGQTIITPSVSYNVTVTDSAAFISENAATHTISWLITFNTTANTFGSSSGSGTLTFTVAWAGGPLADSSAALVANDPPVVSGATAPGTVVAYTSGVGYNELFTPAGGVASYQNANVLVPYGNATHATCLITLDGANGGACDHMITGEIYPMTMDLAGNIWTVNFIAYSIHV